MLAFIGALGLSGMTEDSPMKTLNQLVRGSSPWRLTWKTPAIAGVFVVSGFLIALHPPTNTTTSTTYSPSTERIGLGSGSSDRSSARRSSSVLTWL